MFTLPDDARASIRTLYEHWRSISPPGRLPGRQHFDPVDVPALLPNLWLVDVHRDPLRFYHRLVGSRIEELAGQSLTGLWFAERLSGEALERVTRAMQETMESREPSWRRGRPRIRWEKEHLIVERLYLPLAANGVDVDMILAISEFEFEVPRDELVEDGHRQDSVAPSAAPAGSFAARFTLSKKKAPEQRQRELACV